MKEVYFPFTWLLMAALICYILAPLYKGSILKMYVSTLKVWYRHSYKKRPMFAGLYAVRSLKNHKQIQRLPKFIRNIWTQLIEQRLQELRNEILSHGEVPSF